MFWTLVVFAGLFLVLRKYAFGPITEAVRNRELALEEAIAAARADRDAAAKVLAEQRAQIEAARGEAQKLIAEGRATAEAMRGAMLEETRRQQQELLDRTKRDIESEKARAIAELRMVTVDLAIAAAAKAIEKNLDDTQNRKLVEGYLSAMKH